MADAPKYVYFFGGGEADGSAEMKNSLGGKGANLAEMTRIGVQVPAGFTIPTEICNHYSDNDGTYPEGLREQVDEALKQVEKGLLPFRRPRIDAGHDGHGAQHRPQRADGPGPRRTFRQ